MKVAINLDNLRWPSDIFSTVGCDRCCRRYPEVREYVSSEKEAERNELELCRSGKQKYDLHFYTDNPVEPNDPFLPIVKHDNLNVIITQVKHLARLISDLKL